MPRMGRAGCQKAYCDGRVPLLAGATRMHRFPRSRWRPRRKAPPLVLIVLAMLALAAAARLMTRQESPGEVSGWSRVIDGDSLQVAGREVRLVGIDAPEGRQTDDRTRMVFHGLSPCLRDRAACTHHALSS